MNKLLFAAISFVILISSCSKPQVMTTESGVAVNFIEKKNGGAPKDSTILTFNMLYKNEKGSELFNTAKRGGPVPIQYTDSIWRKSGLLYEALSLMEVGDSATFEIPTSDLFVITFKAPVPDSLDKKGKLTFFVGLEGARTVEEFQTYQKERVAFEREKRKKDAETQKMLDGEIIDKYLQENNIEAQTTESGLRYVITQAGQGDKPLHGQSIVAHYDGTLLDGTKFDSSHDRNEPFEFVLGQRRVIQGWEEGFALLNEGSKATLYVPSGLAYGPRSKTDVIKENSILKFEVELVEIK